MTLNQLNQLNEKFQKSAMYLSELLPSGSLVEATSSIIRGARKIDTQLLVLLRSNSESRFNGTLEKIEDEMDDILFVLDQLSIANRKQKISLINDFVKEGYSLLSTYSKCFDAIIEQNIANEE